MNWIAILISGLVPVIIGIIWYHDKAFGKSWQRATGLRFNEVNRKTNPKVLISTFLFGLMFALLFPMFVIHQSHIMSAVVGDPLLADPNSELSLWLKKFNTEYGNNYRTFKHGAFHGFLIGLFTFLPMVAIIGLYERKSTSYILINSGYWIVCATIIGGIISAWQ